MLDILEGTLAMFSGLLDLLSLLFQGDGGSRRRKKEPRNMTQKPSEVKDSTVVDSVPGYPGVPRIHGGTIYVTKEEYAQVKEALDSGNPLETTAEEQFQKAERIRQILGLASVPVGPWMLVIVTEREMHQFATLARGEYRLPELPDVLRVQDGVLHMLLSEWREVRRNWATRNDLQMPQHVRDVLSKEIAHELAIPVELLPPVTDNSIWQVIVHDPKMPEDRFDRIMGSIAGGGGPTEDLTFDDVHRGWHFCAEMDEVLLNAYYPGNEFCKCIVESDD